MSLLCVRSVGINVNCVFTTVNVVVVRIIREGVHRFKFHFHFFGSLCNSYFNKMTGFRKPSEFVSYFFNCIFWSKFFFIFSGQSAPLSLH